MHSHTLDTQYTHILIRGAKPTAEVSFLPVNLEKASSLTKDPRDGLADVFLSPWTHPEYRNQ